jgi:type III pantothenate kinase
MNILAIDSGNTRIKWGLMQQSGGAGTFTRLGALTHDESGGLRAVFASLPAPQRIAVANVAGVGPARVIEEACAPFGLPLIWAKPAAEQCGVVSRYASDQLGADRWAALIGAWHRQQGACLVVGAGTATTADLLCARGEFRGGIIFPGLALMKRSLAENTARLPFAEGVWAEEPRNTADAIESGVLNAQAGAIERMHAQLARTEGGGAMCLLSGGAAARIAERLSVPHRLADHLVLDGLARIALDTQG